MCRLCKLRKKDWVGSDPRCAFSAAGKFNSDNWNCATMNVIREHAEPIAKYSDDQNAAMFSYDGSYFIIGWYKSRGCTEAAYVLTSHIMQPMTLEDAELLLTVL